MADSFRMTASRAMSALARAVALGLALLATAPAHARDLTKIRIGTEGAYPPFNFVGPDGVLKGFEIDLARAICAAERIECVFVAQDWDGLIPGLLASKYDAIFASMSITEERKTAIDFSEKYYSSPSIFVADTASGEMDVSPQALAGKVVGAQSSTVNARYLEEVAAKAGAEVKLYPTQEEAQLDLVSGRLDALLADKLLLEAWLSSTDEGKCCRQVGRALDDPAIFGAGIGAGLRKGDAALKALIDRGIASIRADGTYARINARYFPVDLY